MTVQLPVPPVAINVDASGYGDSLPKAWKAQKAAAVTEYARRDSGATGDIVDSGSFVPSMAADTTTPAPLEQVGLNAGDYV